MVEQQRSLAMFEDDLDALRDAVRALGGTKVVGHTLRPDIAPDQAAPWLKDCLNSARREKLDLSQVLKVLRMAHDIGHHGPALYLAAEMGYTAQPIEPQDEIATLQRSFIQSVQMQRTIADRIERLTRSPLQVAKS